MGFKRVGVSYVGTYSTMVLRDMWSTWEVPTNGTWKVGIKDVSPINYGRTLAVGPSDAFSGLSLAVGLVGAFSGLRPLLLGLLSGGLVGDCL